VGAIALTQIPDSLLVPGHYEEIDSSLAGTTEDVKRVLVVDLMGAGTATPGGVVRVSSEGRSKTLLAAGSPADQLCRGFLAVNKVEELWALPIKADATWTKTKKKIKVSVTTTEAGTLVRYIGGLKVQTALTANQAKDKVASALVAAINSVVGMAFEASVDTESTDSVILEAVVAGPWADDIDIASGLYGEVDPSGVTLEVSTVTNGAGSPDLATILKATGETRYHYILTTLASQAEVATFESDLADRYVATRQLGCRAWVPLSGDVGDETTAGSMIKQAQPVNSSHVILVPRGNNPQSPALWLTQIAGRAIRSLAEDPASNTEGIEATDLVATESYSPEVRQSLLLAGIATWKVTSSGTVVIERLVTSYTENTDGDRDTAYLDVQIVETADAIRTYRNALAAKRFKGWKLASTDENFGAGSKVMTASLWKAFLVEVYGDVFIKDKAWCQDLASYKDSVVVQLKTGSKTRLEYRERPTLIGQFLQSSGLMQFE
jgi:phage tail sheath gpL-like